MGYTNFEACLPTPTVYKTTWQATTFFKKYQRYNNFESMLMFKNKYFVIKYYIIRYILYLTFIPHF